jgi:hypothetical protein
LGVIELFCIFALLTTGINHYNKSAKNEVQHGRAVPERTVQTPTLDGPNYHFGRAKLTLWTGLGLTYLTSKTLLQVKLVKFWSPNFLPISRLFIIFAAKYEAYAENYLV